MSRNIESGIKTPNLLINYPELDIKKTLSQSQPKGKHKKFSDQHAEFWFRWKNLNPSIKSRILLTREQFYALLGVQGTAETTNLTNSPEVQKQGSSLAIERLGKMWGIEGDEDDTRKEIENFGVIANRALYIIEKSLPRRVAELDMSNAVDATNDPYRLGLFIINPRTSPQTRFEAKRKLFLLKLAGDINQIERESNISQKFDAFNAFLNENVWSRETSGDDTKHVYFLSDHDPKDLKCNKVNILEGPIEPGQSQIIQPYLIRSFNHRDHNYPVYTQVRKKLPENKILKILRRRLEHPATAVDDDLGMMVVVESPRHARLFAKHLMQKVTETGSLMTVSRVEDSLDKGTQRQAKNTGSSPLVSMFKFHANWNGLRTENIFLTREAYMDYQLRDEVSHNEYELRRLFDTGVIAFLYPPEIYRYDLNTMRTEAVAQTRRRIRSDNIPHL